MSFKRGELDWSLMNLPDVENLPAVRWKLLNIRRIASNKREHANYTPNPLLKTMANPPPNPIAKPLPLTMLLAAIHAKYYNECHECILMR